MQLALFPLFLKLDLCCVHLDAYVACLRPQIVCYFKEDNLQMARELVSVKSLSGCSAVKTAHHKPSMQYGQLIGNIREISYTTIKENQIEQFPLFRSRQCFPAS